MSPSRPAEPTPKRHHEPLVLVAIALGVGIIADRCLSPSILVWWVTSVLFLGLWFVPQLRRLESMASLLLLVSVAGLGGAYHHWSWQLIDRDDIYAQSREELQPMALECVVVVSPRIIPAPPANPLRAIPIGDRTRFEVQVTRVRDRQTWRPASGHARFLLDGHLLGVRCGDRLRAFVVYERPTPALNPGEFDFAEFERSSGRLISLLTNTPECITVLESGSLLDPRRWLDETRREGSLLLRKHISPQQASLAAAVMLGEREALDAEQNERFLVTGTVHLLAISGLNLAILAGVFWFAGRTGILTRRGTLMAAIAFAVIYALITDAGPPVVRASVLITVFCIARWSGRPMSPWNVLSAAAIVVLALNPAHLFHVGAQLSFLAVATIAWFQPYLAIRPIADPLDRLIAETRSWPERVIRRTGRRIWQVVLTGALIWLISVPLVWLRYNLISPIAVPLNPVVAIPMALALHSGFGVLMVGWLFPPLGWALGRVCDVSLYLLEATIRLVEPLHAGYHWLPAPPAWWIGVFYIGLGIVAIFPAFRPNKMWCWVGLILWSAIAALFAVGPRELAEQPPLRATFVSVGHGAAVLVELPDGKNLLYDCGRLGSPLSGARPIASVLWSRGITRLDAVMISHADSDHYNAFPELIKRFDIGAVYVSTRMWVDIPPSVELLKQAIEGEGIPIIELRSSDRLRVDVAQSSMEVLHPPRGGVFGNDNANSIVLLVEHQGRRLLLTGDLEERGLKDLLAEPAMDVDILMAPHHGSLRTNPQGLVDWCRPEFVVISGTRDYELGRDPDIIANAFRAAGSTVFHTAEDGSVAFEMSRRGVVALPWRERKLLENR